jgi:hypothetical protein
MKKKAKASAKEIREKLPQIAAATGAPAPGEGRTLPSIPANQTIGPLAHEVAQCLHPVPLFRRGESLVTVDKLTGETLPMTADRWPGWHHQYFIFHTGEGENRKTVDLNPYQVRRILASEALRAHVRELRAVNLLRLPT